MRGEIFLRPATKADSRAIWIWRNDFETRANSFNTKKIPFKKHEQWFAKTLSNPFRLILIAMSPRDRPIGMVRLDFDGHNNAEISVNLAPEERGKGFGTAVISKACEYAEKNGIKKIIALVKEENQRSAAAFLKAGFKPVSEVTRRGIKKFVWKPPKSNRS